MQIPNRSIVNVTLNGSDEALNFLQILLSNTQQGTFVHQSILHELCIHLNYDGFLVQKRLLDWLSVPERKHSRDNHIAMLKENENKNANKHP